MGGLRVAIVGAGPAGLTLARLLQLHGDTCTVFELDHGPTDRDQGGCVDLHQQGGQRAVLEAGLSDEFARLSRPEADVLKLVSCDGTVIYDENGGVDRRAQEHTDRPEIDRAVLRRMLLDALAPGTVVWDRKLRHLAESAPGSDEFALHFQEPAPVADGFDLVVGADGAWSQVRHALSPQGPIYSGVTAIELWANDVETGHRALADFVGAGSCFMFDEGRAIQCQRSGPNTIRLHASVRQPETWLRDCGIDWTAPDQARQALVDRYFADCGPALKHAVLDADDHLVPRPMWMLPLGHRWESRPGVTLVGDAAHLMTPYAGVGVNLAMLDAVDLAHAIRACEGDRRRLPDAIRHYEAKMLSRGDQFARKTLDALVGHFSADGVEAMACRLAGK